MTKRIREYTGRPFEENETNEPPIPPFYTRRAEQFLASVPKRLTTDEREFKSERK